MHRFIMNTTLLPLCHSEMFRHFQGYLQGVQLTHFNNRINTMS